MKHYDDAHPVHTGIYCRYSSSDVEQKAATCARGHVQRDILKGTTSITEVVGNLRGQSYYSTQPWINLKRRLIKRGLRISKIGKTIYIRPKEVAAPAPPTPSPEAPTREGANLVEWYRRHRPDGPGASEGGHPYWNKIQGQWILPRGRYPAEHIRLGGTHKEAVRWFRTHRWVDGKWRRK